VRLIHVGSGAGALRPEKRLRCTEAGLDLALELDKCTDAEALRIPFTQTPAVLLEGRVALSGLPRTEHQKKMLAATSDDECKAI
jgi:hypothetical protein